MANTDKFPDVVRIESSGACNFQCCHCSNGQKKTKRTNMSPELFNTLISQFKNNNYLPRVAVMYHGGEPLLNPNTTEFISKLHELGVKTKIVTNSSLLTKEISKRLIEAGLDEIEVSYDGKSPEENDFIRKNANFEKNSQNLLDLLELHEAFNSKMKISISNVQICSREEIKKLNEKNVELKIPQYILNKFEKYKKQINYKIYPAMVWPGYDLSNTAFSSYKLETQDVPKYCSALFETITVLSDGSVVPCCYDIQGINIWGNINDEEIFDIWNKKNYQNFRNSIKLGMPPLFCKKCLIYNNEYLIRGKKI